MKEAIKLLAIGISVCSLAYIRYPFIDREYTHSQKATEVSREKAKHQLYSWNWRQSTTMKLLIIATFLVIGSSAYTYPRYHGYRQNIQCMQMLIIYLSCVHVVESEYLIIHYHCMIIWSDYWPVERVLLFNSVINYSWKSRCASTE